jgi:hypothetical protein
VAALPLPTLGGGRAASPDPWGWRAGGAHHPLASFFFFLIKQSIYNKLLLFKLLFHITFHNTNHYTQLFQTSNHFLPLKNNIFQSKNSTPKHIFLPQNL